MSLTPTAATLIGSIAHADNINQNLLKIERAGFDPKYLEAGPGREVAAAALSVYRQGMAPNILNVMAAVGNRIPKSDWIPIVKIWQDGYGDVDPIMAVQAARSDYKVREAGRIHAEMGRLMLSAPADVDQWLPDLQTQLQGLTDIGLVYDPRPETIYQDEVPAILFRLRMAHLNDLLRGGVRSGMLAIVAGISGHGKSTLFYTLACECIVLGQGVVFIDNESGRRQVLDRILRGLTHLTVEEISTRQGSTPERRHVLTSWLKHSQHYLRIYEAQHYKTSEIERILRNDRPSVLIVDYMREVQGMVARTYSASSSSSPVGDMGYFLLGASRRYQLTAVTGVQVSDKAADDFKADSLNVPELAYGTKLPYFATDLWIAQKLDPVVNNMSYDVVSKDRIANNRMSVHNLPFNPHTWIYEGPLDKPTVDVL